MKWALLCLLTSPIHAQELPDVLTWGYLGLRKADLLRVHSIVQKGTQVLILP